MIPARIAYALGALGLTLPGQTFGTYLAFYYLDHLGLAAGAFALARLVFSVWDAVNDPLFGQSGEAPGPNPGVAFRFLMAVPPFVATLLALGLALRFPYGAKG